MNLLDIFKPLQLPSIKSPAPAPATLKLPSPDPIKISSIVSPEKPAVSNIIQSITQPINPVKVRTQDWYDVLNILPQIAGSIVGPAVSGVKSIYSAVTGNPTTDTKIPLIGPKSIQDRGSILDAQSSQNYYNEQLDKGVDPQKAFWNTALKTVGDISVLVPLARDVGKVSLLKTAPEKLINPEVVSATRQQIRDFVSGADTYSGRPSPLPQPIQEAFKVASPEEKISMIRGSGIDLTTVKPSLMGKLFGISQQEADQILGKLYGAGIREGSAGALPGYRADGGPRMAGAGASTERVEPVGFNQPAPFQGFQDISTTILNKLEGRSTVSKQFISDLTNSSDLKQPERDLIRKVLAEYDHNPDIRDLTFGDLGKIGTIDKGTVPVVTQKYAPKKVTQESFEAEKARLKSLGKPASDRDVAISLSKPEGNVKTSVKNDVQINVKEFADKVKSELLPLKVDDGFNRYENISLPSEQRGPVANYTERIYESPIETSAGTVHFDREIANNYFAHTRIEDLPKDTGTRRVIELQSDLFQKGRLENELGNKPVMDVGEVNARADELKKLEPYRNTWHERVIREEVKQAAIDGKTKLQFPTGETAMKIEGLGENRDNWSTLPPGGGFGARLKPDMLRVGMEVQQNNDIEWIITDVLGDGKFKAVPKIYVDMGAKNWKYTIDDSMVADGGNPAWMAYNEKTGQRDFIEFTPENKEKALAYLKSKVDDRPLEELAQRYGETFDISGKVDQNNPIYKFYEKEVGRYLKNKYGATLVTDPQGVKWWEVSVPKEAANEPVVAYAKTEGKAQTALDKSSIPNTVESYGNQARSTVGGQNGTEARNTGGGLSRLLRMVSTQRGTGSLGRRNLEGAAAGNERKQFTGHTEDSLRGVKYDLIDRANDWQGQTPEARFNTASQLLRDYHLPDEAVARFEQVYKSLPAHIQNNFGGLRYIPDSGAHAALGVDAFGNWTLQLNPEHFDKALYEKTRLIDHEVSGHLTYKMVPKETRQEINKLSGQILSDEKLFDSIWNGSRKFTPEQLIATKTNYLNDDIRFMYSRLKLELGDQKVQEILERSGFLKEGYTPIDPPLDLLKRSLSLKQTILAALEKEGVGVSNKLRTYLENNVTNIGNELFARSVEYAAENGLTLKGKGANLVRELAQGKVKAENYPIAEVRSGADRFLEAEGESRTDLERANKERNKELDKESKANAAAFEKNVIDEKIGQLEQIRDDLHTALQEHPAKPLIKFVSRETGRLPEVTGRETMQGINNKDKTVKNSLFGKRGDTIIPELGYTDLEDAQRGVDEYLSLQKRLNKATINLIDARKEVARYREAKADEKSLTAFLNKTASETEKLVSARDRQEQIKKKEAKRQELLKVEEARRLSYRERIEAARMKGRDKGFLKRVRNSLFPMKGLDKETKDILTDWVAERLIAKDVANETANEMSKKGPQTMEEIIAYESGKSTSYIREAMDDLGTQAKEAGLEFPFKDNYLPHVYAETREQVVRAIKRYLRDEKKLSEQEIEAYLKGNELPAEKAARLKLNPFFTKQRIFPSYSAAIKAGLTPRYRSPAKLIAHYQEELENILANKRLLENLRNKAKLLTDFDAPDHWVPVTKRFSQQVYYADPELARLLNDNFRDEDDLDLLPRTVRAVARVSRLMQEIKLSAGIPFTNINYFSTGQAIRILTTAVGDAATGNFPNALSSLKSSFAYIRANSNNASTRFFYENRAYIARMAMEGIDISGRIGNFHFETLRDGMRRALSLYHTAEGFKEKALAAKDIFGVAFDKAFNEKTFNSMMSQVAVQTFKDSYDAAIRYGATDEAAGEFAAKVVRNFTGMSRATLRGRTVEDTLTSAFFAPKFREGVINIIGNTAASLSPKNLKDASYAHNRAFLLGAIITFGLYQWLNQKTAGKYTWQNPAGREFAWRISLPNGQVGYVEFLPSFLSFPRNLASGSIALGKGDFDTAIQKFGSVFSMPMKLATELISNSDYFGREIYKDTDSGPVKLEKMAAYVGLGTSHPFITETYNYVSGKEPLYQAISYVLEAPLKYSSLDKESKSAYYDMLDKQTAKRAEIKDKIRPIYEKNQDLIAQGKRAEAVKIYSSLSKDDRTIYDQIKRDEKTKATNARKPFVNSVYENNQRLKESGDLRQATKNYRDLSASDRKIYDAIKRTHELLDD